MKSTDMDVGSLIAQNSSACFVNALKSSAALFLSSTMLTQVAIAADTYNVLHSFSGGADGAGPASNLISDGSGGFYGATCHGGEGGSGVVFELLPPSSRQPLWTEVVLYTFTGFKDGGCPIGRLSVDSSGAIYGATLQGGIAYRTPVNGVAFKLTPPASGKTSWTETVLHSFTGALDGGEPSSGLTVGGDGFLYGTTPKGGKFGYGVVYRLTPPRSATGTWVETVIHSFTGGTDGAQPTSAVLDRDGKLYGTVPGGRSNEETGVVYQLEPPALGSKTWTYTVIHTFKYTDGYGFDTPVFDNSGVLYGVAEEGGIKNHGFVYQLAPPTDPNEAWKETVIYNFSSPGDGVTPVGQLTLGKSGEIYGTTLSGGVPYIVGHGGVVYRLEPPTIGDAAWSETILHYFPNSNSPQSSDYCGFTVFFNNFLYGITFYGGTKNNGTVFELQ